MRTLAEHGEAALARARDRADAVTAERDRIKALAAMLRRINELEAALNELSRAATQPAFAAAVDRSFHECERAAAKMLVDTMGEQFKDEWAKGHFAQIAMDILNGGNRPQDMRDPIERRLNKAFNGDGAVRIAQFMVVRIAEEIDKLLKEARPYPMIPDEMRQALYILAKAREYDVRVYSRGMHPISDTIEIKTSIFWDRDRSLHRVFQLSTMRRR